MQFTKEDYDYMLKKSIKDIFECWHCVACDYTNVEKDMVIEHTKQHTAKELFDAL